MNTQIKSIHEMRELSRKYVEDKIEFNDFFDQLKFIFVRDFNHPEDYLDSLSKDHQHEILFYNRMIGGFYYDYEEELPKDKNWKYGQTTDKYGWIDKQKYKSKFKTEFAAIVKI